MSTTIRRIRAGDGPLLRELRIAALTEAPYAFATKLGDERARPPEYFEETAVRHSLSETSTSFVASSGEGPIGMAGAFFDATTGRPFLCALWVAPAFRGKSIGGELVRSAIHWLAERGADHVYAWVADANQRAVGFYAKLGFVNTGVSESLLPNAEEMKHLYCKASACGVSTGQRSSAENNRDCA
jgi:ribosomal protein S18 acetylase RimI-like enzyme